MKAIVIHKQGEPASILSDEDWVATPTGAFMLLEHSDGIQKIILSSDGFTHISFEEIDDDVIARLSAGGQV